ncbi:hypothetical protein P7K49_019266 [Saguinus oedipus]|uniref:Uncharacterized protein n=1 Tax=Saguinus oedipus TaxID=9490 RepID=A0ABQ9UX02_SAGOE|nr:hypothetical protein P7K49_019266 [Saguinus oedipus]
MNKLAVRAGSFCAGCGCRTRGQDGGRARDLLCAARARGRTPATLQTRPVLLVLVEAAEQLPCRAGPHILLSPLLLRCPSELLEREAGGSDTGHLPLGIPGDPGSGIRGKGGGAVVTMGRAPKRPPRMSGSRCRTESTVLALRSLLLSNEKRR